MDNSDPTCTIQNITNECSLDMINDNCRSHRWSMQIILQDDLVIAEYNITDHTEFVEPKSTLDIPNSNTIILDYE